jgi:hypothetical protein
MARRLNNILLLTCLVFGLSAFSQEDDTTPPKVNNYKSDSSFINFENLRYTVARAQITLLKEGALLVRLKTNANTIKRLKTAGNIDLATQVERETLLNNKVMMRAYRNEFTFCPVYFFTSDYSDSVKHNYLTGIFVDSNLVVDPTIACRATFYLIAEQGSIYESSIGFVTEPQAQKAVERGASSKEVSIVLKNRYFIQLHKPFPYFQQGYSLKKFGEHVKKFNTNLSEFHKKNSPYTIPPEVMPYIY